MYEVRKENRWGNNCGGKAPLYIQTNIANMTGLLGATQRVDGALVLLFTRNAVVPNSSPPLLPFGRRGYLVFSQLAVASTVRQWPAPDRATD